MGKSMMKSVSSCLVVALFMMGFASRVYAGFSPSRLVNPPEVDRAADLKKIQRTLETRMVRERLKALGFTQDEIRSRLEKLSGEQIHQLALQLDELRVGGDGSAVIIILLLIAVGVLLYLYVTGSRIAITK